MSSDLVTLGQLADEIGLDKSNARKYVIKHGFSFQKIRDQKSKQLVLALSADDADAIRNIRENQGFGSPETVVENGNGYFYIVQMIPDVLPTRVKLGFAIDPSSRILAYKTLSPTATIVITWKCHVTWEKAAIASIARIDCTLVGGEVYDCGNIEALIARCNDFFALMPK